jgi:hypothetical protein
MNCELEPFGGCEGRLHRHHIVPKSQLPKGGIREFAEKTHPEVLMSYVCAAHHDKLGGIAHTKWAKAFLVYGKCTTFGTSYVSDVLEQLRSMFKGPRPELGLEAILHSGRVK